jgi:fumarate reductase flavoprotein subunit
MPERGTKGDNNITTDIAIIGAGGAGLAAAVEAADNGARVVLLEKRRAAGGNSMFAEGLFAAESPTQKRLKIEAQRDDLFKIAMEFAHFTINPRLIRAFIDKSGDTIRWLEEKGVKFDVPMLYPNQVPAVWHVPPKGGSFILRLLMNRCKELGVNLLQETTVKKILVDKSGAVTGAIARKGNTKINIHARCVIIATGGYGGSKKLLKKYYPNYTDDVFLIGLPHQGDGILMAAAIGADTRAPGSTLSLGPCVQLMRRGKGIGWSLNLTVVAQEPNMVWVNRNGERFIDECNSHYHQLECVNAVREQPGKVSYSLFDESIKRGLIEEGVFKGMGVLFVAPGAKLKNIDATLQTGVHEGTVKIAETWDEIAKWIGANSGTLKATVDEYNLFCDHGHDDLFAKDRRFLQPLRKPPYYAIKGYPGIMTTIGGIKINHRMETINTNDEIIPGLYTIGADATGWESDTYNSILSGSAFGFSLNSGRIAGLNAAKYISKK